MAPEGSISDKPHTLRTTAGTEAPQAVHCIGWDDLSSRRGTVETFRSENKLADALRQLGSRTDVDEPNLHAVEPHAALGTQVTAGVGS